MSTLRTTSCPGCGAPLEFQSAATLLIVCDSCGGASYRSDVALEFLGRVAEVAPIASPLELHAEGRFEGRRFTVVGQVQLDHGAGPWNEWCLLLEDGRWAWYAEAQGDTLLTTAVAPLPAPLPPYDPLTAGTSIELAGKAYVVAEVGDARVTAVRGELPVRIGVGERRRYADLSGAGDAFGTLDYGVGSTCEAVYLGRRVRPEELGLDPAKAAPAEKRVAARKLSCPKCAGEITLRDPESMRVVCQSCGSLLAAGDERVNVLGVGAALKARPKIPIGTRGTIAGTDAEVIAFLVRSVTVEGTRYAWQEYLLRTSRGAYRWLVEWNGHWSLLDPLALGSIQRAVAGVVVDGVRYRHFQRGKARVDHVQGEVYWEVKVGEFVESDDYVAPPRLLTIESSGKEQNATAGRYVDRSEVEAAFRVELPVPEGVAPGQPNPYEGQTGRWWGMGVISVVALLVFFAVVSSAQGDDSVGFVFPGLFMIAGLLIPPIVVSSRKQGFEVKRWADSDHPMMSSATFSDDDDED